MLEKKVAALTLGCKVNTYDTEAMLELFSAKGYRIVEFEEFADIYIVNTCTVTNLSNKKSRQMLRRARKKNPEAVVVATGCYAQVSPEEVAQINEVNLVLGTKDRAKIIDIVEEYKKESGTYTKVSDIMTEHDFERLSIRDLQSRTRAYLKIQEGCDQYCTYCIIPYARGHARSRKMPDVLEEIANLVENGYKEVVLAGIHVASYGKDLGNMNLNILLRAVHNFEGLDRIRFSSLEPNIITDDFVENLKVMPKVCSHFHLSLQSGCDKTLKNMNRRYTTSEYKNAVEKLRSARSDVAITTDIIVGFPGETGEDFYESLDFVKSMGFAKIHVFQYSPKIGTSAAKYKNQIDQSIKEQRSKEMIALGNAQSQAFLAKAIDSVQTVLFETKIADEIYVGHTENYMQIKTVCQNNIINKIFSVKITGIDGELLVSKLMSF